LRVGLAARVQLSKRESGTWWAADQARPPTCTGWTRCATRSSRDSRWTSGPWRRD